MRAVIFRQVGDLLAQLFAKDESASIPRLFFLQRCSYRILTPAGSIGRPAKIQEDPISRQKAGEMILIDSVGLCPDDGDRRVSVFYIERQRQTAVPVPLCQECQEVGKASVFCNGVVNPVLAVLLDFKKVQRGTVRKDSIQGFCTVGVYQFTTTLWCEISSFDLHQKFPDLMNHR